ncbi:MAG: PspA/IM30 family protein [Patescibacteria group bacterium]
MQSIFSKARVLLLGNLHELLDQVIDLNSIAAVKQHVRDLEDATEKIGGQTAVAEGHYRSLGDEVKITETQIESTGENIRLILGDEDESNDVDAETLATKLISLKAKLSQQLTDYATAKETYEAMQKAERQLKSKHGEMLGSLNRLEAMDRTAKAQEKAAEALKSAQSLTETGTSVSVDDVTARVRERSAVAGAKFRKAMGEMAGTLDATVVNVQAKELVARMKAELKGSKTPEPAPAS